MASGVGFSLVAVFTVLFLYILFCFFLIAFLFRQCRFIGCPTSPALIDSISDADPLLQNRRLRRIRHGRRNALLPSDVNIGFNADMIIPTVNFVPAEGTDGSQQEEGEEAEEEVVVEEEEHSENLHPLIVEGPQLLLKANRQTSAHLISRLSTRTSNGFSQRYSSLSSTEIPPDSPVTMVRSLSVPTVRLRDMHPVQGLNVNLNLRKLPSLSVIKGANIRVNDLVSDPSANILNRRNSESESASDPTSEDAASPRHSTVSDGNPGYVIGGLDMLSDQARAGLLSDLTELDRQEEDDSTKSWFRRCCSV
ncbi:hypothetical protein V1509DRAFT_623093 [Lipomyces kononenkoae]